MKRGRVLSILSKGSSRDKTIKPVVPIPVKNSVFTLDPIETMRCDDAFSIEHCKEKSHSNCKKVGIHVAAVAFLEANLQLGKLATYQENLYLKFPKFQNDFIYGLEKGKYNLAISLYVHTNSEQITDPKLGVVKVTENYKFPDDKEKYQYRFEVLRSCFGSSTIKKMTQTDASKYLVYSPQIWEEFFILDEAMNRFNCGISNFIRKQDQGFFITTEKRSAPEKNNSKEQDRVLLPADLYSKCFGNQTDGGNDAMLAFLATGMRNKHFRKTPEIYSFLPRRFLRSVEISHEMAENKIVKCTSPLRKIHQYLNQHSLIRCLSPTLGLPESFCQKDEILCALGIRFRNPKIRRAAVATLGEANFVVMYASAPHRCASAVTCKID